MNRGKHFFFSFSFIIAESRYGVADMSDVMRRNMIVEFCLIRDRILAKRGTVVCWYIGIYTIISIWPEILTISGAVLFFVSVLLSVPF